MPQVRALDPKAWEIAGRPAAKVHLFINIANLISPPQNLTATTRLGRSRDGLYEPALADSEREAVADLLQYLENVGGLHRGDCHMLNKVPER